MVRIHTIDVFPPVINSACPWSSDHDQLLELFNSPYTGAVTTRTATIDGYRESDAHAVAFASASFSSINSYGYSPHPLDVYLGWIQSILTQAPDRTKPFIISITASDPDTLRSMVQSVQGLRAKLNDSNTALSRIAIELNTSCPNIPNASPSGYVYASLAPLLHVLADAVAVDASLTVGLKLPPFVYREQFLSVLDRLKTLSVAGGRSPISFFTCTNTLGNALFFSEQVIASGSSASAASIGPFAVPTALGGLAGDALHPLSLGNIYTFANLLRQPENEMLSHIAIIGVGGVTSKEAARRMKAAGAAVVGCATLFGKEGVKAFGIIGDGATDR